MVVSLTLLYPQKPFDPSKAITTMGATIATSASGPLLAWSMTRGGVNPVLKRLGCDDHSSMPGAYPVMKVCRFSHRKFSLPSEAMIDYDTEHGWEWPNPKQVRWVLPMKGAQAALTTW